MLGERKDKEGELMARAKVLGTMASETCHAHTRGIGKKAAAMEPLSNKHFSARPTFCSGVG